MTSTETHDLFSPLSKDEHLFIKTKGGYNEFYIDYDVDKIIMNLVFNKGDKEFMTTVEFDPCHVYEIYKLFENYIKTPILED